MQIDHRPPAIDDDGLLKATLMLTKDQREVDKAFALACCNVLAHNRDDHSKNVSFLMDGLGGWRLAPASDLTFSFGPGGEQSMLVMGRARRPVQPICNDSEKSMACAMRTRLSSA